MSSVWQRLERGVYLDENATATPMREAAEEAYQWLSEEASNASAAHAQGRRARGVIERARRVVGASVGVNPRHLTFCSGATEALHSVVLGHLRRGDHVIASAGEHPALWGALELAQELLEIEVSVWPLNRFGELELSALPELLTPKTRLVAVMAAQNELGVTYPTRLVADELERWAHARGGEPPALLCDCVQAWGKLPLKLEETGATFATLSGHKLGAPIGVGVLWCREGAPLRPFLRGGSQERGRRAGTESVAAIAGLMVAASQLEARLEAMGRVRALRDQLAERLSAHPRLTLNTRAPHASRWVDWRSHGELPNTLSLRALGAPGDLLLQSLDLEGFYLSSGSACSSGALSPSPVLLALGLSEGEAAGGLRVSIGPSTPEAGLWRFAERLTALLDELPTSTGS